MSGRRGPTASLRIGDPPHPVGSASKFLSAGPTFPGCRKFRRSGSATSHAPRPAVPHFLSRHPQSGHYFQRSRILWQRRTRGWLGFPKSATYLAIDDPGQVTFAPPCDRAGPFDLSCNIRGMIARAVHQAYGSRGGNRRAAVLATGSKRARRHPDEIDRLIEHRPGVGLAAGHPVAVWPGLSNNQQG